MKNLVMILVAVMMTTAMFGQRAKTDCEDLKKMKTEMKALQKDKMAPFLQAKHDELDAALPASDLQALQALRAENKILEEKMRAIKKEMKVARKAGEDMETLKAENMETFKSYKMKKKAIMEKLKPIMTKNEALIKRIGTDIKAQNERVAIERKAIAEKYASSECVQAAKEKHEKKKEEMKEKIKEKKEANQKEKGKEKTHGKMRHGKGKKGGGHGKMTNFLLWDGEPKAEVKNEKMKKSAKKKGNKVKLNQNFPNPAMGETTIEFALPNNVNEANLVVTDMQGKVVFQKSYGELNAGTHQEVINVNDWTAGTYFYSIKAGEYKKTKKLVVGK